jgi:cold shock CspA family protein
MAETWNKKERENKKKQHKKEKAEKKLERKEQAKDGNNLESMLVYLDENGNFTNTPPDPRNRVKIKLEDIVIGTPKKEDLIDEDPVRMGIVTFFNNDKGYGFIKDSVTGESVFVHINSTKEPIKENNKVQYEVEMGAKGPTAVKVSVAK